MAHTDHVAQIMPHGAIARWDVMGASLP